MGLTITTQTTVRRATILDLKELSALLEAHCMEWDAEGFPFDEAERIRFAALRLALSCAAPNAATDQVFRQAEKYAAFLEGTPDQAEASP